MQMRVWQIHPMRRSYNVAVDNYGTVRQLLELKTRIEFCNTTDIAKRLTPQSTSSSKPILLDKISSGLYFLL